MDCKCIDCPDCGGSGRVWFSLSGEYIGRYSCDDLDHLGICDTCNGSGVSKICAMCKDERKYYQPKLKE